MGIASPAETLERGHRGPNWRSRVRFLWQHSTTSKRFLRVLLPGNASHKDPSLSPPHFPRQCLLQNHSFCLHLSLRAFRQRPNRLLVTCHKTPQEIQSGRRVKVGCRNRHHISVSAHATSLHFPACPSVAVGPLRICFSVSHSASSYSRASVDLYSSPHKGMSGCSKLLCGQIEYTTFLAQRRSIGGQVESCGEANRGRKSEAAQNNRGSLPASMRFGFGICG